MSQQAQPFSSGDYQIGQLLAQSDILRIYTAFYRPHSSAVGLIVILLPPTLSPELNARMTLMLNKRKQVQTLHLHSLLQWTRDEHFLYLVTDPPRGTVLQDLLEQRPFPLQRALQLTMQLALGIQGCHEQGWSGLDLRPQLLTIAPENNSEHLQIDDLGIRNIIHLLGYTNVALPLALHYFDPAYLPPEYFRQGQFGVSSDLYQLSILLFLLLTGNLPFVSQDTNEIVRMQIESPIPPITPFMPIVPPLLQGFLNKALAKESQERFLSAKAFVTALGAVLDQVSNPALIPSIQKIADHKSTPPIKQPLTLKNEQTIQRPPVLEQKQSGVPASIQSPQDTQPISSLPEQPLLTPPIMPITPETKQIAPEEALHDENKQSGTHAYFRYEPEGLVLARIKISQETMILGRRDPKQKYIPDIDLSGYDPRMSISRQHARIRFENNAFTIEDLRSRNKTRLQNNVLAPFKITVLQHGDVLFLGKVRLRFEIAGYPELTPLPAAIQK